MKNQKLLVPIFLLSFCISNFVFPTYSSVDPQIFEDPVEAFRISYGEMVIEEMLENVKSIYSSLSGVEKALFQDLIVSQIWSLKLNDFNTWKSSQWEMRSRLCSDALTERVDWWKEAWKKFDARYSLYYLSVELQFFLNLYEKIWGSEEKDELIKTIDEYSQKLVAEEENGNQEV